MRWVREVEGGHWISSRLTGPIGSVSTTIPSGFDAYARILHPSTVTRYDPKGNGDIEEDYTQESWTWARIAEHTQTVVHPQVQWIRVTGHQYDSLPLPGNRSADPPPLGHLAPLILARVMMIAGKHTTTADEVTAALWEGWGITSGSTTLFAASVLESETGSEEGRSLQPLRPRVDDTLSRLLSQGPFLELPGRRYVLLSTSTAELVDPAWPLRAGMGWTERIPRPMPQLIWPADHAWALVSEIDFDSTLVGGTHDFVNEIMNDPAVEAVRVKESTDLTWDADDINRPH
jgi:hypothetical protein